MAGRFSLIPPLISCTKYTWKDLHAALDQYSMKKPKNVMRVREVHTPQDSALQHHV